MNLCGVTESVMGTPVGQKARPMPPATRPPPSPPLKLSIPPPPSCDVVLQTPLSYSRGEGMTATPSPALLNPLTHEFWNESFTVSNAHHHRGAAPSCPRLETTSTQTQDPLLQRLQSGFRVVSIFKRPTYICVLLYSHVIHN